MKIKINFLVALILIFSLSLISQEISLGTLHFPMEVKHGEKILKPGNYRVVLIEKEENYYFQVFKGKDLRIEELGIVIPRERKGPFKVVSETLKGNDYFRIKVYREDKIILGYFYSPK
ncbi:MAG: hypothetical protein AB1410_11945 [Acidobacteriota bacterium]